MVSAYDSHVSGMMYTGSQMVSFQALEDMDHKFWWLQQPHVIEGLVCICGFILIGKVLKILCQKMFLCVQRKEFSLQVWK